ncbi:hypothetical protein ACFW04_013413 [Cataglyphis niger]
MLEDGIKRGPPEAPIAQETKLGWVLSGPISYANRERSTEIAEEDASIKENMLSEDEQQCEKHFKTTLARNNQSRFVVRLPVKCAINNLGDSRSISLRMFNLMEKRFFTLRTVYVDFIRKYLNLDHMRPSSLSHLNGQRELFLPHHSMSKQLNN